MDARFYSFAFDCFLRIGNAIATCQCTKGEVDEFENVTTQQILLAGSRTCSPMLSGKGYRNKLHAFGFFRFCSRRIFYWRLSQQFVIDFREKAVGCSAIRRIARQL